MISQCSNVKIERKVAEAANPKVKLIRLCSTSHQPGVRKDRNSLWMD